MRKSFCIAGVMILLGSLARIASAAPYYLPDSTYGEDNGWSGYKIFENEEENINVMLTFNVYDMQTYSDEVDWVSDIDFPDTDRYLYAYQLINANNAQTDVTSLNLVDLSGNPIAQFLMHLTQAVADPDHADAVMPDPNPSDTDKQGSWTWSPGVGYINAGELSTFLIFSSAYAPVAGDFRVVVTEQSAPPAPSPEPASIVLLGGALAFIVSRRHTKNNRHS